MTSREELTNYTPPSAFDSPCPALLKAMHSSSRPQRPRSPAREIVCIDLQHSPTEQLMSGGARGTDECAGGRQDKGAGGHGRTYAIGAAHQREQTSQVNRIVPSLVRFTWCRGRELSVLSALISPPEVLRDMHIRCIIHWLQEGSFRPAKLEQELSRLNKVSTQTLVKW